jgi:hypothetical protein
MKVTIYRGAKAPTPIAEPDLTWGELCIELQAMVGTEASTKTKLLALGPYRLRPESKRLDKNVEAVTLLAMDVDRCNLAALLERCDEEQLAPYAMAVYGSPSDDEGQPDARRVRVVLPVSREITAAECRATRLIMAEVLDFAPGCGVEGAIDASRLFFVGQVKGTPERFFTARDGLPIDVDELLGLGLEQPWGAPAAKAKPTSDAAKAPESAIEKAAIIAERMPPSIEGHGGDAALFAVANELASVLGEDAEAIEAALADVFNPRCMPPWPTSKLRLEAARAAERQASPVLRWARRVESRKEAREVSEAEAKAFAPPELADLVYQINKQGEPRPTHFNVDVLLRKMFPGELYLDDFEGKVKAAIVDERKSAIRSGDWSDVKTTELVKICEVSGLYVSSTVVGAAVVAHATANRRNPWADSLRALAKKWDRTPRVDGAMARYWGAPDDDASRAVGRVMMLSLAARGMTPGTKVDTCPVLIGAQGTLKSTSLKVLVGGSHFSDTSLPIGDKDALQSIQGKALWELGEHASLSKKDQNAVKAFLSASEDTFRASYGRFAETKPRTCCFVSTSNDYSVLTDPTGARRFMPVEIGIIDIAALAADREQLLGEAAARVLAGEQHWPTKAEEEALHPNREAATQIDPWEDMLEAWLAKRGEAEPFRANDTVDELSGAIPMPPERVNAGVVKRIGSCLRRLGYTSRESRVEGVKARRWCKQ